MPPVYVNLLAKFAPVCDEREVLAVQLPFAGWRIAPFDRCPSESDRTKFQRQRLWRTAQATQ